MSPPGVHPIVWVKSAGVQTAKAGASVLRVLGSNRRQDERFDLEFELEEWILRLITIFGDEAPAKLVSSYQSSLDVSDADLVQIDKDLSFRVLSAGMSPEDALRTAFAYIKSRKDYTYLRDVPRRLTSWET